MAFPQAGKTIWSELFYIRILTLCLIGKPGSQNHPHTCSQSILPSAQPITKPLNCLVETETEEQIELKLKWNTFLWKPDFHIPATHTGGSVVDVSNVFIKLSGFKYWLSSLCFVLGQHNFHSWCLKWTDREPVKMPMDNLWWSILPNHCVREACCLIPYGDLMLMILRIDLNFILHAITMLELNRALAQWLSPEYFWSEVLFQEFYLVKNNKYAFLKKFYCA